MKRIPFVIYLKVSNEEKHFIQFHETHMSAWRSGEQILRYEFPGQQGEVIRTRMLSGLEHKVMLAGWDPIGKTNEELLTLVIKTEYALNTEEG